ncbi:hypothetical protein [Mesorhizobium qingshengii]|uniref:Uncharacterized protein n=1 Tax=Mesorhizobium qingshengii TaxID=1165689 RepID=A0A1G5ZAX5_9HYPH|nr:hypothetical protein [Mesorhizobium qingshengii]SDA91981.1 hypothetical protein SAMN02927914_04605 [Mesorhizobium qingshengii]
MSSAKSAWQRSQIRVAKVFGGYASQNDGERQRAWSSQVDVVVARRLALAEPAAILAGGVRFILICVKAAAA